MTTPNPDAEVIEKLAKEIAEHIATAEAMNATLMQNFSHPERRQRLEIYLKFQLTNFSLTREQAAVNAAIRECAEALTALKVQNDGIGVRYYNEAVKDCSEAILAKLKWVVGYFENI